MKTSNIINTAIGLGVLFATVWVVGKAWRKSQENNFTSAGGNGERDTADFAFCRKCNCNQFTCRGCDKCRDKL